MGQAYLHPFKTQVRALKACSNTSARLAKLTNSKTHPTRKAAYNSNSVTIRSTIPSASNRSKRSKSRSASEPHQARTLFDRPSGMPTVAPTRRGTSQTRPLAPRTTPTSTTTPCGHLIRFRPATVPLRNRLYRWPALWELSTTVAAIRNQTFLPNRSTSKRMQTHHHRPQLLNRGQPSKNHRRVLFR